ncbi:hypothetical protein SAMN02927900_01948 [Rhizobium mongolense subsp. loessense]|uniref:Uncharacterized protein n=1 Tax=Rhizobium mongolense subsp. loessense TaxID=158890 RepID=A0A1G4QX58_9HYPH|nr:hypothetical protein SAMN02927900_01948 [Rhizobium mongolense subsp. loessense]
MEMELNYVERVLHNLGSGVQVAPARHYSRLIKFIDEVAKHEPHETSTSVDFFSNDDNKWYCQIRCGKQRTQPMGPYTKRQAGTGNSPRRIRPFANIFQLRKIKLAAPTKPACLPSCAGTTGTSR